MLQRSYIGEVLLYSKSFYVPDIFLGFFCYLLKYIFLGFWRLRKLNFFLEKEGGRGGCSKGEKV